MPFSFMRKLAIKFLFATFLLNCLLLVGCGGFVQTLQISSMAQKKQHHEIIKVLQPQIDQQVSLSSFDLYILSGAYYEIRDYQRCIRTVNLMQQRIDQGETSYVGGNLTPLPRIVKGYLYLDQGDYPRALQSADEAYRMIDTPEGRSNVFFRSQLIQISELSGVAQALMGNRNEARRWAEIAGNVAIDASILGPEKYIALARINMALQNYREALSALRNPNAKISGITTTFYDQTFQELPRFFIETKALFETGAIPQARQGYDQLLNHPQIREIGGMYWPILFDRARIARSDGDIPLAEKLLHKAIEVVELQRATIATEAGRIGFVGDKQALYQEMVSLLVANGRPAQAFEFAERAKSRALVDLLASVGTINPMIAANRHLLETVTRLERAEQESTVIANATTRGGTDTHKRGLITVLKQELAQEAPEFASLVSVTSPLLTEIQNDLHPDETLLEYFGSGKSWYVFVVKRNGIWAKQLIISDLEPRIQSLRTQFSTPHSSGYQQLSQSLHRQLIEPVANLLSRRLVIVPHGILHYLPFNALQATDGSTVIEQHTVRNLPAAGITRYIKPLRGKRAIPALILGNPDRGDRRLALQHAQEEAEAISSLLPGSVLVLGNKATRSAITAHEGSFRFLHIAAHGVFDAEAPLNSAILLAKNTHDNGLLRASDLYNLQLNTDLVTLSACETALSTVAKGDDLLGFTRGFLYAGARSIVASLWKVDDLATKDLMLAFYRNISNQDKALALALAQREIKKSYKHPFYWAAFQLTGAAE